MTDQSSNLGARIAKGAYWTVAMRMAIRMLGIINIIILARILVPEDYGAPGARRWAADED